MPVIPTDALGRPLREGDKVVWSHVSYKSASWTVGVIEKIRYKARSGTYGKWRDCDPSVAERFTLTLDPIKKGSGGLVYKDPASGRKYTEGRYGWSSLSPEERSRLIKKKVGVTNVDNVILLDAIL